MNTIDIFPTPTAHLSHTRNTSIRTEMRISVLNDIVGVWDRRTVGVGRLSLWHYACRISTELLAAALLGPHNAFEWRHNGWDGVSNHQPHNCLLKRFFRRRSKKKSMLRVTGLCVGNSPVAGEFPAQMANNAENVSVWWRHHGSATTWASTAKWGITL